MKSLLVTVLLVFAFGVAGPPLYHAHELPLVPAIFSAVCLSLAAFLMDPTDFLAWSADMRKTAVCWWKKGEP